MQESVCIWVFDQSLLSAKADSSKNSFSNIGNSIHQIRVGHWVLVSHYNFDISAAQIIQIGVVTEIEVEKEKFVLDMASTDLLITPGPNGIRHWQKPYFSLGVPFLWLFFSSDPLAFWERQGQLFRDE